MADDALLHEIKELIVADQRAEHEWRQNMLDRFDIVNGTVRSHSVALALAGQTIERHTKDLDEVCVKVRNMELSQTKAATIGAIIGAMVAALPQLIMAVRALMSK